MRTERGNFLKEIGPRIKQVRLTLDYSQERMASVLGVTRSSYCRYESGKAFPGSLGMEKLASGLNVSLDWLMSGAGDMFCKNGSDTDDGPLFTNLRTDMRHMVTLMHKMPMIRSKVLSFYYELKREYPDIFAGG